MTKRIEDLPIGAKVVCAGASGTIVGRVLEANHNQQLIILSEYGNIHTTGMDGKGTGSALAWIPAKEKRKGWMNVYQIRDSLYGGDIYNTKETADTAAEADRIDCVQVEWEE